METDGVLQLGLLTWNVSWEAMTGTDGLIMKGERNCILDIERDLERTRAQTAPAAPNRDLMSAAARLAKGVEGLVSGIQEDQGEKQRAATLPPKFEDMEPVQFQRAEGTEAQPIEGAESQPSEEEVDRFIQDVMNEPEASGEVASEDVDQFIRQLENEDETEDDDLKALMADLDELAGASEAKQNASPMEGGAPINTCRNEVIRVLQEQIPTVDIFFLQEVAPTHTAFDQAFGDTSWNVASSREGFDGNWDTSASAENWTLFENAQWRKLVNKSNKEWMVTYWKKDELNQLQPLEIKTTEFEQGRPIQIIKFPRFTVINVHAPRNGDLRFLSENDEIASFIPESIPLIVAGDFNNRLNEGDLTVGGIQVAGATTENTCCDPTFEGELEGDPFRPIDHILVSEGIGSGPREVLAFRGRASDHKPVKTGVTVATQPIPSAPAEPEPEPEVEQVPQPSEPEEAKVEEVPQPEEETIYRAFVKGPGKTDWVELVIANEAATIYDVIQAYRKEYGLETAPWEIRVGNSADTVALINNRTQIRDPLKSYVNDENRVWVTISERRKVTFDVPAEPPKVKERERMKERWRRPERVKAKPEPRRRYEIPNKLVYKPRREVEDRRKAFRKQYEENLKRQRKAEADRLRQRYERKTGIDRRRYEAPKGKESGGLRDRLKNLFSSKDKVKRTYDQSSDFNRARTLLAMDRSTIMQYMQNLSKLIELVGVRAAADILETTEDALIDELDRLCMSKGWALFDKEKLHCAPIVGVFKDIPTETSSSIRVQQQQQRVNKAAAVAEKPRVAGLPPLGNRVGLPAVAKPKEPVASDKDKRRQDLLRRLREARRRRAAAPPGLP